MTAAHQNVKSICSLTLVLTGPAIWSAHFFVLYATEAFLCTFPATANSYLLPIDLAATVIAVAALVIFMSWQALRSVRVLDPSGDTRFLRDISITLAAIAMLAVTWGFLPATLLPVCTPAT